MKFDSCNWVKFDSFIFNSVYLAILHQVSFSKNACVQDRVKNFPQNNKYFYHKMLKKLLFYVIIISFNYYTFSSNIEAFNQAET